MRVAPLLRPALCLLAALLLGACHGQDDAAQPGGSNPVAAVQASVDLIRAGDFNALWKHLLPPADYAHLRADWNLHQRNLAPITAAERERFDRLMQQLTAPDAADRLYVQWQPKLAAMERQYGDQLPILISVGEVLASVTLSELSRDGDRAVVRIDYRLQGTALSTGVALVREHGRWYSQGLLENVRRSHRQLAEPAVTRAPAAAGSVAGAD